MRRASLTRATHTLQSKSSNTGKVPSLNRCSGIDSCTHLEVAVDDVLLVKVLHRPQQGPHKISRFLLVVVRLGHDPVEKLATFSITNNGQ